MLKKHEERVISSSNNANMSKNNRGSNHDIAKKK